MTPKALGISVSQKLINLQRRAGIPFSNLVTVFLIERLVARLIADASLYNSLVFKGGFVSMKVYDSSRYTVDLDALLVKSNILKTLEQTRVAAESDLKDGVWFCFESQIDLETQGEYGGIRQVYRAGIGEKLKLIKKAQIINFDLGIGDPVTPGPVKVATPTLIFKNDLSWRVYPIETMITEKRNFPKISRWLSINWIPKRLSAAGKEPSPLLVARRNSTSLLYKLFPILQNWGFN